MNWTSNPQESHSITQIVIFSLMEKKAVKVLEQKHLKLDPSNEPSIEFLVSKCSFKSTLQLAIENSDN